MKKYRIKIASGGKLYKRQSDREGIETEEETTEIGADEKRDGAVSAGRFHCLTVIGQIEGHFALSPHTKTTKYEHVLPALVAIEESSEIEGLLMLLNTAGGDVEAGLAIAELIASMKKPVVSLILGGGHSIGVPLAVSARYSFIAPSATMTIHPVRVNGPVVGTMQTFTYFERMQERIIRFVTDNSRISPERFRRLMGQNGDLMSDVGSLLNGDDAVKEGIIDSVGGLKDALAKLKELCGHDVHGV